MKVKEMPKRSAAKKPAAKKPVAKKAPARAPKKPAAKKLVKSPYIRSTTISDAVRGGVSNPGESRVINVGKHKVLLTRSQHLDRYGNPIHTASVIRKDGSIGGTYRASGSAALTVSKALAKEGIETKYVRRKR